jgi:SAM-dependent methyltransferase
VSKSRSWYDADYYDKDPTKGYPGPYTLACAPWARLARAIVYTLGPLGCTSAVDFGCARGFVLYYLQRMGWKAKGYDWSAYAVRTAMEGVDIEVADVLTEGFAPQRADLAICMDMMEHIEDDKVPQVLKTISDAAGKLVLFQILLPDAPYYDWDKPHEDHVGLHPREWWDEMFKAAGLRRSSWEGQYKVNVKYLAKGALAELWAHDTFLLEHDPDAKARPFTLTNDLMAEEWKPDDPRDFIDEGVDGGADTEAIEAPTKVARRKRRAVVDAWEPAES